MLPLTPDRGPFSWQPWAKPSPCPLLCRPLALWTLQELGERKPDKAEQGPAGLVWMRWGGASLLREGEGEIFLDLQLGHKCPVPGADSASSVLTQEAHFWEQPPCWAKKIVTI